MAFPQGCNIRAFFPADNGARKLSAKHKEGHKLPGILKNGEKRTPFLRYEKYNTHAETDGIAANDAFDRDELIFGVSWKVAEGAAFKADYQIMNNAVSGSDSEKIFNAGIAIWF